jgi:hypothetical protein
MTRTAVAIAATLALASGCASARAAKVRSEYLQAQLEPFVYQKPIGEIWIEVLRLLNEKGYPLAGHDAVAVGQSESWFGNFTSPGSETKTGTTERATGTGFLPNIIPSAKGKSKDEETWRYLKTGLNKELKMYRVDAALTEGGGWRVAFTSYEASVADHNLFISSTAKPDWKMALELMRRVDPAAAARIEAGMP